MATWGRWGGTAVSSLPVRREVNANGQEKAAEDRDQRHRVDRGHRYSNYLRSNSVLTARQPSERLTGIISSQQSRS